MIADSVKFRGHRCFKTEWSGFDKIMPVNVIIGRNNTGKSHLLDLIEALCEGGTIDPKWRFLWRGVFDDASLMSAFAQHFNLQQLQGELWRHHGKKLSGKVVTWSTHQPGQNIEVTQTEGFDLAAHYKDEKQLKEMKIRAARALEKHRHPFANMRFRRLLADRDVKPEAAQTALKLYRGGEGATNVVQRYLTTSNQERYPRDVIQRDLLDALRSIFGADGSFTEIEVHVHDEDASGSLKGHWEIYLGEEGKGLVPLSNSGSGLKTVLLVLLNLLVVPKIDEKGRGKKYVFAFEELENNLHPALLRRLLQYIEQYALGNEAVVFLTTHSSTALDMFGASEHAQIIHVSHDGQSARTTTIGTHFDKLDVVSDLGAKPSDLLQANGIVWVEGPSDRTYLNRWIEILTDGSVKEGKDYQCAFFGGQLLACVQVAEPESAVADLANLLNVNPNLVVVCDRDGSDETAGLKPWVKRVREEVAKVPRSYVWVTEGKEIENYIPGAVLSEALKKENLPDPGKDEVVIPRSEKTGDSYLERHAGRKTFQKPLLAKLCAPHMTKEAMERRLDWKAQMESVIERIKAWNG